VIERRFGRVKAKHPPTKTQMKLALEIAFNGSPRTVAEKLADLMSVIVAGSS
jgi:hypothetical protein